MSKGTIFWVLWLLGFIFSGYWGYSTGNYYFAGGGFLTEALTFLLGWQAFGFVVKD